MRILGYFIVAACGLVVDLLIFFGAIYLFNINYFIAGFMGFTLGFLVNFMLGRKYVFNTGHKFSNNKKEMLSILFISVFGLGIHQFILFISVDFFLFSITVGKFLAVGITFLWNFFGRKYIYNGEI